MNLPSREEILARMAKRHEAHLRKCKAERRAYLRTVAGEVVAAIVTALIGAYDLLSR